MIDVQNLSKSFGPVHAVDGVSMTIGRGEFAALIGANGAGKTTLIRLLAGLSRPTDGRILIGGCDTRREAVAARRLTGVIGHDPYLYPDLTAQENLRFYSRMFGLGNAADRVRTMLERVGLDHRRNEPVRSFSRGMLQRLALARALLHDPPLLLFDEPFTGLDIYAEAAFKEMLRTLIAQDRTVLMALHDISYALRHAGRILVLRRGRLVLDRPSAGLNENMLKEAMATA